MTSAIAAGLNAVVGAGAFIPSVISLPVPSVIIIPGLMPTPSPSPPPAPGPPAEEEDSGGVAVAFVAGFVAASGGTGLLLLALKRSGVLPGGRGLDNKAATAHAPAVKQEFDNIESAEAGEKGVEHLVPAKHPPNLSRESRDSAGSRTSPGSVQSFDTSAGALSPGSAWAYAIQNAEEVEEPYIEQPWTGVVDVDEEIQSRTATRETKASQPDSVDEGDDQWTGAGPTGYVDIVCPEGETNVVPARGMDDTWPGDVLRAFREDPVSNFTGDTLSISRDDWKMPGDEQPRAPSRGLDQFGNDSMLSSRPHYGMTEQAHSSLTTRQMSLDYNRYSSEREVIMHMDFAPA